MRRVLFLVAMLACDQGAKTAQAPKASKPTPADPWAEVAGAAGESDPAWVHDPPRVLRDKILAVHAHVIVLKSTSTFAEYRDVLSLVESTPGVIAAEPFIFVELEARTATHAPVGVVLKGVDPQRVERIVHIAPSMKSGTMAAIGKGEVVIGDDLARALGVAVGDQLTLTTPAGVKQMPPQVFRVGGTFHIGMDEFDERLLVTSLASVQAMLGRGDNVMGVEATVRDLDKSGDLAKAIETKLGGPPYQVQDWYELNHRLFTALYGVRRP